MTYLKKILPACAVIFLLTIFILPAIALAADPYFLMEPLPIPGGGEMTEVSDINVYLSNMYKFGVAIAGILAFVMLVWGGFEYLMSASFSGKQDGKEIIWSAVYGLLIVLGSWVILNTINPKIVTTGIAIGDLPAVTITNPPLNPPQIVPDLALNLSTEQTSALVNDINTFRTSLTGLAQEITDLEYQLKETPPENPLTDPRVISLAQKRGEYNRVSTLNQQYYVVIQRIAYFETKAKTIINSYDKSKKLSDPVNLAAETDRKSLYVEMHNLASSYETPNSDPNHTEYQKLVDTIKTVATNINTKIMSERPAS